MSTAEVAVKAAKEHFARACELMERAERDPEPDLWLDLAQIHATLAIAAALGPK